MKHQEIFSVLLILFGMVLDIYYCDLLLQSLMGFRLLSGQWQAPFGKTKWIGADHSVVLMLYDQLLAEWNVVSTDPVTEWCPDVACSTIYEGLWCFGLCVTSFIACCFSSSTLHSPETLNIVSAISSGWESFVLALFCLQKYAIGDFGSIWVLFIYWLTFSSLRTLTSLWLAQTVLLWKYFRRAVTCWYTCIHPYF